MPFHLHGYAMSEVLLSPLLWRRKQTSHCFSIKSAGFLRPLEHSARLYWLTYPGLLCQYAPSSLCSSYSCPLVICHAKLLLVLKPFHMLFTWPEMLFFHFFAWLPLSLGKTSDLSDWVRPLGYLLSCHSILLHWLHLYLVFCVIIFGPSLLQNCKLWRRDLVCPYLPIPND